MPKIKTSKKVFANLLGKQSEQIFKELKADQPGSHSLAGWFLGPKSENSDVLKKLVLNALEQYCQDRVDTYPGDPVYVTEEIKQSREYQETINILEEKSSALLQKLKGSVPFWSYRWQSHMNWDTTLPAMIGYFGAMLYADPRVMELFPELGSDQIIITYAFNFKINGVINTHTEKMNALNFNIFNTLSLSPSHDDADDVPLMITQSQYNTEDYGNALVDNFKLRLGVSDDNNTPVTFLISTTMNPWLTDTADGNFIPTLTQVLRKTVEKEVEKVISHET